MFYNVVCTFYNVVYMFYIVVYTFHIVERNIYDVILPYLCLSEGL